MIIIIWLLCGIIGLLIGQQKNRPILGLCLGIALGLIGIIILLILEPASE